MDNGKKLIAKNLRTMQNRKKYLCETPEEFEELISSMISSSIYGVLKDNGIDLELCNKVAKISEKATEHAFKLNKDRSINYNKICEESSAYVEEILERNFTGE